MPTFEKTLSVLTKEQIEQVRVECLRQIEDLFKKGEPLAYDAILIVAKK
jgi:hypothetical protein